MLLAIFKAAAIISFTSDATAVVRRSVFGQRTHLAAVKHLLVRSKANTSDAAMVRVLNVAEKNDAAKSLSDIMSAGRYTKVIVL